MIESYILYRLPWSATILCMRGVRGEEKFHVVFLYHVQRGHTMYTKYLLLKSVEQEYSSTTSPSFPLTSLAQPS